MSDLVKKKKKTDYDGNISEMEKNILVLLIIMSNTLDAKITQKKFKWNQSGFNEKIKRLATKEEIGRTPDLKAEQDRIVKL